MMGKEATSMSKLRYMLLPLIGHELVSAARVDRKNKLGYISTALYLGAAAYAVRTYRKMRKY